MGQHSNCSMECNYAWIISDQ